MPLVPAKCTQCGAILEVDNSHDAAICKFCGTPFIVEKAINNYNTTVTNNNYIGNATFIQEDEFTKLLNAAEGHLKLGQIDEADKVYTKITKEYPQKFEGWYGILVTYIENLKRAQHLSVETLFGDSEYDVYDIAYKNARKLATDAQHKMIDSLIEGYSKLYKADKAQTKKNVWFVSYSEIIKYVKDKNIFLGSAIYYRGNDKSIVLENGRLKLIIQKSRAKDIWDDSNVSDEYIYTISGYDPDAACFLFEEQGIFRSPYTDSKGQKMNKSSLIKCDVKLVVEDYDRDNLFPKYNGDKYSNVAQYFCKLTHQGETEVLYLVERKIEKNRYVPSSNSNNNKSSGCYIATCVYGSYDCPEVWTLRRFRDNTLDETRCGRAFIKCYYAISPTLVKWFGNQKWFRTFWKANLDHMVSRLNKKGIENTKYNDKY